MSELKELLEECKKAYEEVFESKQLESSDRDRIVRMAISLYIQKTKGEDTADEPATDKQKTYLLDLRDAKAIEFTDEELENLTKKHASSMISKAKEKGTKPSVSPSSDGITENQLMLLRKELNNFGNETHLGIIQKHLEAANKTGVEQLTKQEASKLISVLRGI